MEIEIILENNDMDGQIPLENDYMEHNQWRLKFL